MLTGFFNSLYIFTIIILVHEFGHFLAGKILNWKVEKIEIYPYGGCTKFNVDINSSILQELFVLVSGPLLQIIFYYLFKDFISYSNYFIFKKYNYSILLFNLIPIYPLDGGRLLNLFFSIIMPYKKSLYISIYISFIISIVLFLFYRYSLSFSVVVVFLVFKIFNEKKMILVYYNKFLLERHLKNYNFKGIKIVNNIYDFYKSKRHLIRSKNGFCTEKEALSIYFNINKTVNTCVK